mgnify:CR=1 FL=1
MSRSSVVTVIDQYGNRMVDSTGKVWDKDSLKMHLGRLYFSKIQGHITQQEWSAAKQTYLDLTGERMTSFD